MKEIKEFKLDVPQSLEAISLRQYQKWMKILTKYEENEMDDENYIKVKLLQTFCNLNVEDTYDIPLQSFDGIVNHISQLFADTQPLVRRFKITDPVDNKDYDFGLIPNFDKMTFGEYVDIDTYINDIQSMHKALAVLFRPVSNEIKDVYKVQKYKGSEVFANVMLDAPMSVVFGVVNFIVRLQKELAKATLASSQVKVMGELERQLNQISEENTDGSLAFTLWLKKTHLKSMMQ